MDYKYFGCILRENEDRTEFIREDDLAYHQLQEICAKAGFGVYLGSLEKVRRGTEIVCTWDYNRNRPSRFGDDEKTSYSFCDFTGCPGAFLEATSGLTVAVDLDNIIHDDRLTDRNPENTKVVCVGDNPPGLIWTWKHPVSTSCDYWYNLSKDRYQMVVITPLRNEALFLLNSNDGVKHTSLMEKLLSQFWKNPADYEYLSEEITPCCKRIIQTSSWRTLHMSEWLNTLITHAIKAISHLDSITLFEEALPFCYDEPVVEERQEVMHIMAHRYGYERLQTCLENHLAGIDSFDARLDTIRRFTGGKLDPWHWRQVKFTIQATVLTPSHVLRLVDISKSWAKEPDFNCA